MVEYVHSDGVSASQGHLLSEGHADGPPPMRVRLLGTGRVVRASVHRVRRGDDMQLQLKPNMPSRNRKTEFYWVYREKTCIPIEPEGTFWR